MIKPHVYTFVLGNYRYVRIHTWKHNERAVNSTKCLSHIHENKLLCFFLHPTSRHPPEWKLAWVSYTVNFSYGSSFDLVPKKKIHDCAKSETGKMAMSHEISCEGVF